MDKYEYRVKTEQLLEYTEKKQYRKAMEIADTIDWRRVKNTSMLNTVSEVYEYCGEFQKSRDILFMAFDRSPGSRKIVYRLATLALKVNDSEEASDCYEEFVKLAPKDPNQYILKYRILKAQRAPLEEQIAALEEFKKAEYIEKWAYELAKLYHEAGMVRECLEECDDLILWFSEGKYVYLAMELKMKYKPLTPLQQEKYDKHTGKKTKNIVIPGRDDDPQEDVKAEITPEPEKEESQNTEVSEDTADTEKADKADEADTVLAEEIADAISESAETAKEAEDEEDSDAEETPVQEEIKPRRPITQIVTGATLEEALASGVAMAAGLNQEEKAMADRDEELKLSGQMKIEDILQEWEEKQKMNADAIEKQKAQDKKRLEKERLEAEKRKEASRKAAEEAARKAEEEASRKAAEEAKRKAEEAEKKKAAEEAARKEAEEMERKAEEAARKAEAAAKRAEEARKKAAKEAAKKAEEAKAVKKVVNKSKNILEEKTQRLPDDIMELVEQLESRVSGSSSSQKTGEPAEDSFDQEEVLAGLAEDFASAETTEIRIDEALISGFAEEDEPDEAEPEEDADEEEGTAESGVDENEFAEDEEDEFDGDEPDTEESEEDFEEDGFIESSEDEFAEDEFEEEESEEDGFDEDEFDEDDFEEEESGGDEFDEEESGAGELEEDEFEEEESEEDEFDEDEFDEDEFDEDEFDEDEFAEDEFIESGEDEFDEDEFDEDDFDEDEFEEEESDVDEFDEDEFDEDEFDEDEFEEEGDEDEFDEDEFDEDALDDLEEEEISFEIEEPSEEEIQKRFKKAKGGGGVPFDTGFVVTGRYDLSATSEIGLKAGLTEEQKKLFSYFVPVRGMSEQIVEALDNDRRAQREGTSKTGNLLVIGRKGSGKTVLAVDIVKAIQKQRNLKQGKVAIVTGESLNKKELPNIIQKLKGGAIIVEKAGKLNSRTVKELNFLMERKTGEMLFVLEDQRKPLEKVLTANPEFKKKFTSRLELPIFINDELVTFGQTYAKENGYKLDEMGILALYSRIDVMQREDHAVSVAEVKEIMDEAISHSQRVNVKHLARRVFGKGTDDSDRIILKEEDFKI